MPTCGRLSRWMAASRSDFYDSISTSVTNSGLKLGDMAALFVPGLNLVVGKVVRITRTLKASTSFPVLYLDKDIVKLPGLTEVAVNVFDGVSDITSESLPQTYSVSTSYMWCNAKECVRVLHCEVLDGKFCMDEQDKTFIKTKLPAFMENERERVRREKEGKLEKIRKLKEGNPKDMTVISLREVLLEMGVNFKASDFQKKLVERVLTERSNANRANNASREHTTDAELIQDQASTSSNSSSTSLTTLKILHVLRFHSGYPKTSSRAQHQCGSAQEQYILCLLY